MYYLSWLALAVCLFGCGLAAYLALSGGVVSRRTLLPLTILLAPVLLAVALGGAFAVSAALKTPQEETPADPAGRPLQAEEPFQERGERTVQRTAPEAAPEKTGEETTSGPEAPAPTTESTEPVTGPTTTFGETASPTAAPSPPATSSPSAGAQAPR